MARPFYVLQATVARYSNSPDDPEALGIAGSGILEGIDTFNLRTWNFMLRTSGFGLVAGENEYSFPSGVRAPRHMALTNGGQEVPVGYLDPKSFFLEWPSVGNGQPTAYTLIPDNNSGSTVRFNNAPSASDITNYPSGTFVHYQRISYPATSGSTLGVLLKSSG